MINITGYKWSKRNENHPKSKSKSYQPRVRIRKWKEHFKNQLENLAEVTATLIENIINGQLNTKLKHFTEEELIKLKAEKLQTSTKYLL